MNSNKQTTLITFKNYILKLSTKGEVQKARVADVFESETTFEQFAGKNIKTIKARMSWLSEKNRNVIRTATEKSGIELVQVMTDPSIITDLKEYFEAAMIYERKTQPTLEITDKEKEMLKTLVDKYNKKSIQRVIVKL